MEKRIVQILHNDVWYTIPFDHIKNGDTFKLFEEDGSAVTSEGKDLFIAVSEPYLIDGVWGIECDCKEE